jgi:parallel beta-helix repeat protein
MTSLLACLLLLTINLGAPSALAVNKVLSLDGDGDYVQLPDMGNEVVVTVEVWAKAETHFADIKGLVSTAPPDQWKPGTVHFKFESNEIQVHKNDGVKLRFPAKPNQWYHCAYTSDTEKNELKLYVNGKLIDTGASGTTPTNLTHIRIGSEEEGRYFFGILDEVRIWNVARTKEEIRADINQPRADINQPVENPELLPNLVGYFSFEDGTVDQSQYSNDGTLQGDATIVESERSKIIFVPTDYPTIQAGIDASNPGDTVIVDPETYYENITLKSGIALKGAGAGVTTIDGGNNGSVVKMSGISDVIVSGFTIKNGSGDGQDYQGSDNGGGIAVYECSNIVIRENTITQNHVNGALADGGGILICKCTAPITIWQNNITGNYAENWGGGICIQGTFDIQIDANDISNNDAVVGDGISLWEGGLAEGASAWIINNRMTNNQGDGIYVGDDCSVLIGGNRDNANDIIGNTEYAVRNDSTNHIDATYNHWGTTVEQDIQDAIYDYYDDASKGVVNYEPWVDGTHRKGFPFAQALSLDGDGDSVFVPHSERLNVQMMALEAWILPVAWNPGINAIVQKWEDESDRRQYLLTIRDGNIHLYISDSGSNWPVAVGQSPIPLNKWTHVAGTYDGDKLKIYVNGKFDGEISHTNGVFTSDVDVMIGGYGPTTPVTMPWNRHFNGSIDEVRIWNVVRTQAEIQETMNTTLEGNETGLVGYFSFDDGTANDSSLYSNHGTLMGDAEIVPLYGTWPPPLRGDTSGNGEITAYDAHLILKYIVGLLDEFDADSMGAPSVVEPHDYEISIPEMETSAGKRIQVPIAINDATGLSAGGITMKYNPTVLQAVDYAPLKLLNGYYWKANTNLTGEVRFAFASAEPAKGQGNLLMVEFEVLPSSEGKTSPLILDNVNLSNSRRMVKINGELRVIPSHFALLQNYPNPFNPETWLPYKLAQDAPVTISVYNARGQLVRSLNLGTQRAGVYLSKDKAAYWNGKNGIGEKVASGMYFYTLEAGNITATRRMLIVK